MPHDDSSGGPETLGRIALKQVRVSRAEVEARTREASQSNKASNPMNRLVPYLDLFCRLSDDELARLSRAPLAAVEGLRQQVDEVNRALGRYVDLLPRLSDDELARLTGATIKTIRFWRLSQPRHMQSELRPRSNPDVTPTPQPLPRRDSSSALRSYDDAEASELSSSSSSSSSARQRAPSHDTLSDEDPSPSDSSTFVIDTIE
jgi:hypothetical protein